MLGLGRRRVLGGMAAALAVAASAGRPVRAAAGPGRRRLAALLLDGPESWRFLEVDLAKALAERGWTEGANLETRWRYARSDAQRLDELARDIVAWGPHAVLARGTPATRALQQATKSVPIVTGVGDPVGSGFAASLAQPGGNITGVSYALAESSRKRFELLREARPSLAKLTIVLDANRRAYAQDITGVLQRAALEAGTEARVVIADTADDVRAALRSVHPLPTEAALVVSFGVRIEPKLIADAALGARVPAMFEQREYVEAGGLMSYLLYWDDQTGRTADQIDKIFRGMPPASIPFEFPTRSELALNLRTARAIGVELPQALLARADRVIA